MLRPHIHPDRPSRIVGLLAFFVGIAMLGAVFYFAYDLFTQPVAGLNLSVPPHGNPPPAATIGVSLASFFEKLLLLALLTIVGSITAGRGVHLCFAAAHATHHTGVTETIPEQNDGPVALTVTHAGEKTPPEKTA
jgi:membrane protease YdiL (CAAX protease family)